MLQSVQSALRVFEAVASQQPIGVSELARKLRMTKSTVQRCLGALNGQGWIRSVGSATAHSTRWVITTRAFSLGRHAAGTRNLRLAVLPIMEELRDKTSESVHLVVADGRDIVLLERLESPHTVRIFRQIGSRAPLHATAAGKAMLAQYDPVALDGYLNSGLESRTSQTIQDPDELKLELQQVCSQGWALSVDELSDGASAVAACVLDRDSSPIAALAVSCPTSRFPKSAQIAYAGLIVSAVRQAEQRLLGQYSL